MNSLHPMMSLQLKLDRSIDSILKLAESKNDKQPMVDGYAADVTCRLKDYLSNGNK
jgi:hypothetical protein